MIYCIDSILIIIDNDERINIFRKFLGIGDLNYRREILDNYILVLKCNY